MKMDEIRQLIQVVPRLLPTRCGVSDHALALAGELKTTRGIDSAFVVLNSDQRCDVPYPVLFCPPDQLLNACDALRTNRPAALLVHVSGYGYSPDGAPSQLAVALHRVKAQSRLPVAVFFHELAASGMPWSSAFWHARRQKKAFRAIVADSDLLVTNTGVFADWLQRQINLQAQLSSAAPVKMLPVFSLVGEPELPTTPQPRDPAMAVFGLAGTRQGAYRELPGLAAMLHRLGVQEILDIGPDCEAPRAVGGIPVRPMGVLAAADIDRQFMRTAFGYLAYPPNCLAKSGVFAGYCAHGVVPVIAQSFSREMDGLKDGVHVLSPQTARAMTPAKLQQCSVAAWNWYAGHRLRDHAAVYARWFEAMGSMSPDAGRSHA